MKKAEYIERYIKSLHEYFNDWTDQGRIAKYQKTREQEFVLENVFGMSQEDVKEIYNEEYRKSREEERGNV